MWAVGDADGIPYPMSNSDLDVDASTAARALEALRVAKGDRVLVVSMLSEACLYWPVVVGAIEHVGAIASTAEATAFEGPRLATFLTRLRFKAVIGVSGQTLQALHDVNLSLHDAFSGVDVILARPDALVPLLESGLSVLRCQSLGPILAIDCPWRRLHISGDTWRVEEKDGRLVAHPSASRAVQRSFQINARGRVHPGSCECGRADPWIEVTE
jgi:hypothetical protein